MSELRNTPEDYANPSVQERAIKMEKKDNEATQKEAKYGQEGKVDRGQVIGKLLKLFGAGQADSAGFNSPESRHVSAVTERLYGHIPEGMKHVNDVKALEQIVSDPAATLPENPYPVTDPAVQNEAITKIREAAQARIKAIQEDLGKDLIAEVSSAKTITEINAPFGYARESGSADLALRANIKKALAAKAESYNFSDAALESVVDKVFGLYQERAPFLK